MSRVLPTGFSNAVTAAVVRPAFFLELNWSDGILYVWSGYGSVTFGGKTYVGTGHLGKISDIRESKDLAANGVTVSMSGIPSSLLTEALASDNQGKPARIYLGALAADGTLATTPYLIFDGKIDLTIINDSGTTSTISVQLEKELVDNRSGARRYTHEDQKIDYPSDRFFEYVAGLANQTITWGAATATPAGGDVGSGSNDTGGIE
jgi:hypothetical protein